MPAWPVPDWQPPGGLISAFELSGDERLLRKAEDIGKKMLFAFNSPSGLPYGTVGLRSRTAHPACRKGPS